MRAHQAAQLSAAQALSTETVAAVERVADHLATERPWRDVSTLAAEIDTIRAACVTVRAERLAWQEQQAPLTRAKVKARQGFATLTADQSHTVLRPIQQEITDPTPEAIAPTLSALGDAFLVGLQRAETEANELLDGFLEDGGKKTVRKVEAGLRNREVCNQAELDALVKEVRGRVLEQL